LGKCVAEWEGYISPALCRQLLLQQSPFTQHPSLSPLAAHDCSRWPWQWTWNTCHKDSLWAALSLSLCVCVSETLWNGTARERKLWQKWKCNCVRVVNWLYTQYIAGKWIIASCDVLSAVDICEICARNFAFMLCLLQGKSRNGIGNRKGESEREIWGSFMQRWS